MKLATNALFLIISAILIIPLSGHSQERFITIDGTKIWINTSGIESREEGQPLFVFESGLGTPMDHWDRILEGVTELGPWITYDRPGIGKSEPDEELPTIKNVSDKLIKILESLNQPPPYILIGHSLGGTYVRGFAVYYPEKLAGLVIIDPGDFTETQENKRLYYDVLGWEEEKIDAKIASEINTRTRRIGEAPLSIREESQVLETMRENDFMEINSSHLPNIPVHIITGGRFDLPPERRSKEYDEEALFRSKMKHRVARWTDVIQSVDKGMMLYSGDAGHFVHYDDPDLVVSSISIVLKDYLRMKSGK